ncbi:DUF805 domain-containing protein [Tsukamurella ocularis]|uniref:DUF805 domain-containing protein n=1 Tax=Tsukamurella ocularis TaxID=1970234 RepID=UPI002169BE1D|nr:DUF805 domain-containing protein [Tsukamurella ocularis]MCS3779022.1 uncharacterized membrane protein YhaH (DUF805 family) [Tsukamurella ocularis]MCS3787358.1 uncharacterized membrane protein YhaH (DUF805 family) [Tsukamurella ocularis]MCS3851705.1 uncharacterized membrane protein YhaH (DUF805 family) [Tsukamurella ocularis]
MVIHLGLAAACTEDYAPQGGMLVTYGQPPCGGQGEPGQQFGGGQPQQGQYPFAGQPYPPAYPAAGGYGGFPGPGANPGAQDPDDLTLPLYGATFGQGVSRFFRNYTNFSGRASKSEYWWAALVNFLLVIVVALIAGIIATATGGDGDAAAGVVGLIMVVVGLALLVPWIAVSVRRLHDANLSGWLYLLSFVPLVNYFTWIVFGVLNTNPLGARFDRRS